MRRVILFATLLGLLPLLALPEPADSACCYFAAKDKDVLQPAQKAFITWDPEEKVETFTVQPKFEGNAVDFGMVIPTPSKPKLDTMPRDFFKELAVFTILEPMDVQKFKPRRFKDAKGGETRKEGAPDRPKVKIVDAGVVGSLEFKVVEAERADDLCSWLKENKYSYSGDEATLDFYIKKKWFFTLMKIDPKQMKKNAKGQYEGEVTPTRFRFASEKPIYPLRITQISVKDRTEALLYIQAPHKMDLAGDFSFQCTWQPMWANAMSFADDDHLTAQEKAWQKQVGPRLRELAEKAQQIQQRRQVPATLEWARKITDKDLEVLTGKKKYNREAPPEDVKKMKELVGHVKKGQFITKVRKVFTKGEMNDDLEFVRAKVGDKNDDIEYVSILPTSPP